MTNLNKEQARAVQHVSGPCLVLAGPGSGKTHTIVERIRYLIEERGISPREILVITFSKKASVEMKNRFNSKIGQKNYPVYFGTFHSVFFSILKDNMGYSNDSIMTEKSRIRIIGSLLKSLNLKTTDSEMILEYANRISLYKTLSNDENRADDFLKANFESEKDVESFMDIYNKYIERCKRERKIDFDDMLYICRSLLRENEKICQRYRSIYKYILVDEFQDINDVQYDVIMLLAGKEKNIFAVGDDDQSIYGFRGSRPDLMNKFITDNPDINIIDMHSNYRCAQQIIEAAGKLINHNEARIKKQQKACKTDKENGYVTISTLDNAALEAEYVINSVKDNIKTGVRLNDIAILYRTSGCANLLHEKMIKSGIKCIRKSDSNAYYSQEWIQDIVSYLRLTVSIDDNQALYRIINRPERGIERDDIGLHNCEALDELYGDITRLSKMSGYAAILFILKAMKYEEYLFTDFSARGYKLEEIKSKIDELLDIAKGFNSIKEWIKHIERVKEISQNVTNSLEYKNESDNTSELVEGVNFMTVHASKGLEFDVVYIIGLQEGIFPYRRAISKEQIEEERRLMYVAMTRAKRALYIVGRGVKEHGKRISSFISEIQ